MGIVIYSMFRFYVHYKNNIAKNVRGSRKFCQRGSNSDNGFFDEKKEAPDTKIGPSASPAKRMMTQH